MGEIAEMMIDGTLCAGCSAYLHGDSDGDARWCSHCKRDEPKAAPAHTVACSQCGRRVKLVGLNDHIRDAHKEPKC